MFPKVTPLRRFDVPEILSVHEDPSKEVRIVPDEESEIVKNVLSLSKQNNYVLTTGGIGPTHDDITSQSVSKAFKKKYTYHEEAYRILKNYYGKKNFNDPR